MTNEKFKKEYLQEEKVIYEDGLVKIYCDDPVVTKEFIDNQYGGQKANSTKLEMSKLFVQFPRALQAIMLASTLGHNKYKDTDKDWKNFENVPGGSNTYWDANIRHQLDKEIEGDTDPDTGLPHIFHETWNAIAKCELWIRENNIDIKKLSKNFLENLAGK